MPNMVLNEGEKVLFESRFSLIKFLPRWIVSLAISAFMLAIAGHVRTHGLERGWSEQTISAASMMAAAISVAAFLVFLVGYLLYRQQWLVLTDNRLTITWLWNLRSENFVLRNISNINKQRTVLGMLFGYGTLSVQDIDGTWTRLRFVPGVDRLESLLAQASMRQNAR
jgi:hypothetical protein